ncbi:MAG: hypothetical protein ACM3X6_12440 [Patescibacteria group bacterium]
MAQQSAMHGKYRHFLPLVLLALLGTTAMADTIYKTVDGKESVQAEKVVVLKEDASSVSYAYCQNGVVYLETCRANKDKGESLRVERLADAERAALIEAWKKSGYTVQVSDVYDEAQTLHNAALRFDAPPGYVILGGARPKATSIRIATEDFIAEVDFAKIARLDLKRDSVTCTLRNGRKVSGTLSKERLTDVALDLYVTGFAYPGGIPVEKSLNTTLLKSLIFTAWPKSSK